MFSYVLSESQGVFTAAMNVVKMEIIVITTTMLCQNEWLSID